jgi:transcriptional antiterminator Rof (Rho-off)
MTDDPDNYQGISCADYSQYELWIMHRQPLTLAWQDQFGHEHIASLLPVDLRTRQHEEFLVARLPEGDTVEIRLDRIRHVKPADS